MTKILKEVEFIKDNMVRIDGVTYYTRRNKGAKLPLSVLDEGLSYRELAKKYNVHLNTIKNLGRRKLGTLYNFARLSSRLLIIALQL